ncbi:Exonuclease 3'-5' domain-containing protein 1 [Orchesella cincta]|uniref:Exonuclease 3'-5' domain-containing protein 1 n=1 Tax=Orchesella cincta TaxID=48709 RepID=A0A1D2NIM3_ORCCI|nr:Exonuclease 3'-5' domain-containing protein 1 [Orchesella cincta]
MSFLDQIYELSLGAMVEVELKDVSLKGEFSLLRHGPGKNPDLDIIQLERPTELPSGKQRNGTVSLPVKDVINLHVRNYNIFKKQRDFDDNQPASSPVSQSSKGSKTAKNIGASKSASKKGKRSQDMKDLEPVEIMLRTYVVKEEPKLKLLLKLLKEVDVCGMAFEGQNIGRHGVVAWLVLTAGKTLIPIDLDTLSEKMPNLWKVLEKDLLGNPKLVKIMHDSRPAADYLQHAHGINMVNVFDTKVADALVSFDQNKTTPINQLNALSDCLEIHNRRIPVEEIEFLRKHEAQDFSTTSPMLKKPLPPPEYLKLCALKVKHLVPLRENLMKRLMEKLDRCTEAHMDSYRDQSKETYSAMSKDTKYLSEELYQTLADDLGQLII